MGFATSIWLRLKALLLRRRFDRDLEDEMAFHLAMREGAQESESGSSSEAYYAARRGFGNVARITEACREMRTFMSFESFWQDVRYGLRGLLKAPGFTLVAVITLALGIGASTWVFNLLKQWVIEAAAFPEGDRLMVIWEMNTKKGWIFPASAPDFRDWQQQNSEFENLSAWVTQEFNLTDFDAPQRVLGGRVSPEFFRTLKVTPIRGRDFRPEEGQAGAGHVAMISAGMWRERFNSDPEAIGKTFLLDGEPYTLIGVAPEDFHLTLMGRANVWVPLVFSEKERAERTTAWLNIIGRLKPGVAEATALQAMNVVAQRLEKQYPDSNADSGVTLNSLSKEIGKHTGDQGIYTSFVVGICILLISCSNIASIYLARALLRRKEMTMRLALGARKRRLARQLLSENLLLLPLAVALGLGLTLVGGNWITASIPYENRGYLPNYGRVYMDSATFLYATAISLFSLLLFSLAPMLEGRKLDLTGVLKESSGSTSPSGRRLRKMLVVVEIVLALVVLVPAGLTTKSLANRLKESPGFAADHLLTATMTLPATQYKDPVQWTNFYNQLLERVQALPQLESAALTQFIPFGSHYGGRQYAVEGAPAPKASEAPSTLLTSVSAGYISTMGIRLMRGRLINEQDGKDALPVILINETMARRAFPNTNPLGRRVRLGQDDPKWWTIVGVVNNIKAYNMGEPPRSQSYIPFAQAPSSSAGLVIRTSADPHAMGPVIRKAVWAVDKSQPVSEIETLAQRISDEEAPHRIFAQFAGFFALIALFLAAIGIYGVMAYLVESRTREIGIRMACGARARTILWLLLGGNLKLILAGISIGLVFAWAVGQLLESLLYHVTANDPATYLTAVLVLSAAILLASINPMRRAAKVDPMVVLRYE